MIRCKHLQSLINKCPIRKSLLPHHVAPNYISYVRCIRNEIFDYNVSVERLQPLIDQIKMHAGLNNLLERHGMLPKDNSKRAIEEAKEQGLIGSTTYEQCLEVNRKGNEAKHKWCR
jgi:hypothetical protein